MASGQEVEEYVERRLRALKADLDKERELAERATMMSTQRFKRGEDDLGENEREGADLSGIPSSHVREDFHASE